MRKLSTNITLEELERLEKAGELGYRAPEDDTILNIADAHVQKPSVSLSPDRSWLLLCDTPKFTPISHLAANEVSVAGIRIHTQQFNRSRGRSYYNGFRLLNVQEIREQIKELPDGQSELPTEPNLRSITGIPENQLLRSIKWSPDSKFLSFLVVAPEEIQLWVADMESASARKVTGSINASLAVTSYAWRNSRDLICMKAINKDKAIPVAPVPPFSPSIRSNLSGNVAAARTYQNLLTSTYDETLFKFFTTSEACKVTIDDAGTTVHEESFQATQGIMKALYISPDGNYMLTKTMNEPFSYLVPYTRFPQSNQVWDLTQSPIAMAFNQEIGLQEQIPSVHDSCAVGARDVSWIPSSDNTLFWVEAQDEGDPRNESEIRDKLFALSAPFTDTPKTLHSCVSRYHNCEWTLHGFAWVQEKCWKTRWSKIFKVSVTEEFDVKETSLMFDRSYEDAYNSPGGIWVSKDSNARFVAPVSQERHVLLESVGATPKGNLPFLDLFDTVEKTSKRLWRCSEGTYERLETILENDGSAFITTRQSNEEQPNLWIHTLQSSGEDKAVQITKFPDPYPWMNQMSQELVTYTRPDGVLLSGKLRLPENFKVGEDEPLPMLIWAYPREFTNKDAAKQVKVTPSTFTSISSMSPIYWVTQGFAVLSEASMPIVSSKSNSMEDTNDTLISQLIANAETHVNEMVARKIADPNRIAIGGHSYGAFMTANLLAHTNLFCAGIARSGAYNRTLTPFGFQSEDRSLWESGELYYNVSPFNHVKTINAPLLLTHGERDCNSGTYPEQSIRFYNALKGNGCTCRLVVFPFEDHHYKARENILHLLWETSFWLNTFVKDRTKA
mmetsp:Transcript_21429/g.27238  ORF Transcript_21429/g.27238 Transcript_21429/m.27238 type:complete len:842 (-) Transcript_21429:48-2573(-)